MFLESEYIRKDQPKSPVKQPKENSEFDSQDKPAIKSARVQRSKKKPRNSSSSSDVDVSSGSSDEDDKGMPREAEEAKAMSVKTAKENSLIKTDILDHMPTATVQPLSNGKANEGQSVSRNKYVVIFEGSQYLLKTSVCPGSNQELKKQLRKEYEQVQTLSAENPHISSPLDKKEYDRYGTYSLEVLYECRGQNLQSRIQSAQAGEIIDIVRKTLAPLAFLEKKGIFHAGISPASIWVEGGFYKLSDTSCARDVTVAQIVKRSVSMNEKMLAMAAVYAPPEVLSNASKIMLNKIDVYSWGMSIYQLISKKSSSDLMLELKACKLKDRKTYDSFLGTVKELELPGDDLGHLTALLIPILVRVLAYRPKSRPLFAELSQLMGEFEQAKRQPAQPSDAERSLQMAKEKIAGLEKERAADKETIAELRRGGEQNDIVQTLTGKLDEKKAKCKARKKLLSELQAKCKQLETEVPGRNTKVRELEAALAEVRRELLSKSEELTDVKCSLKDAEKELAALRKENYELKSAPKERVPKEDESLKKAVELSLMERDEKIEALTNSMQAKNNRITELSEIIKSKNEQISRLEAQVSTLQGQLQKASVPTTSPYKNDGKVASLDSVQKYITPLLAKLRSEADSDVYTKLVAGANQVVGGSEKMVSLLGERFGDPGAQILALTLRCTSTLIVLNVGFCSIGPAGAQALGEALHYHNSLKMLFLGSEAFVKAKRSSSQGITELQMLAFLLGDMRVNTFKVGKPSRGSLIPDNFRTATRSWNDIGLAGVKALADALRHNETLTHLDLSFTDIGDSSVQELVSALNENSSLKKLYLYLNDKIIDKSGDKYAFRSGVKAIYKVA